MAGCHASVILLPTTEAFDPKTGRTLIYPRMGAQWVRYVESHGYICQHTEEEFDNEQLDPEQS